jgi:hypothetical protein
MGFFEPVPGIGVNYSGCGLDPQNWAVATVSSPKIW